MFDGMKKRKEEKRKAEEMARREKELKERTLINKTMRNLKAAVERYESQKQIFINLAQEAERRGLRPQYNMAANGLKIVIESQDKANAMYLNLMTSVQMKEMFKDTKDFVASMSTVAKQLSEIQSEIDFGQAQYDYDCAMSNITVAEEKLRDFTDNVYDSISDYADTNDNGKVDEAIASLIHNTSSSMKIPSGGVAVNEDNSGIDKMIGKLENMLNDCR